MSARRCAVAAVLALAGAWVVVAAPAAEAVGAPVAGWWSRLATADPAAEAPVALPVPAPTTPDTLPAGGTAPPGQLLVEGTPEGATAIAAIRWELDPGDSSPSLTLPIAPGSSVNPQSIVLACRAATPWEDPGEGPGSWDVKPLTDAVACVNGVVATDLSTVSFGLQPLMSGDVLDIVLSPGKAAEIQVPAGVPQPPVDIDGSSFRLLFDPPADDALQVVAGDFEEGEGDRVVEPPATGDLDLAGGDLGLAPSGPEASFDLPGATGSFEPPAPVASPALEPQDLAPSVPDLDGAVRAAAGGPVDRTVGFVLLLLAGVVALWAWWSSAAPAAAAEAPMGGLSRFARPRPSPPTPLA